MSETDPNEEDIFKKLARELVKQIADQQNKHIRDLNRVLANLGAGLDACLQGIRTVGNITPIHHTAHLAMQALIEGKMRGPHQAEEIAETAWRIAVFMHKYGEQALSKFAEFQGGTPQSGDAEGSEKRDTERPPPPPSNPGDNGPAL